MSQRFLIIRLSSMGDIVHALPAVAALRARYPTAAIDWLVEARWQELVELNPHISDCISVDTHALRRHPLREFPRFLRTLAALRRKRYDCVVDLQGLYKSAVLGWLTGGPRRLGFHQRALREPGSGLFYTEHVQPPTAVHVIESNLALVARLGVDARGLLAFVLPTLPEEETYVEEELRRRGVEAFFILSPGGGWQGKCWPVERYAELHDALVEARGWRGVINVGPGEEELAAEVARLTHAGQTIWFPLTPRQYVALARRAQVVVSGDTGPLHVAAAVGTPVVGLYGPTDPGRTGPFGPRVAVVSHRAVSPVSYQRTRMVSPAMLAIRVDEVVAAIERLVSPRASAPQPANARA